MGVVTFLHGCPKYVLVVCMRNVGWLWSRDDGLIVVAVFCFDGGQPVMDNLWCGLWPAA